MQKDQNMEAWEVQGLKMKILEIYLPGDTRQGPGIPPRRAGEASSQNFVCQLQPAVLPPNCHLLSRICWYPCMYNTLWDTNLILKHLIKPSIKI